MLFVLMFGSPANERPIRQFDSEWTLMDKKEFEGHVFYPTCGHLPEGFRQERKGWRQDLDVPRKSEEAF